MRTSDRILVTGFVDVTRREWHYTTRGEYDTVQYTQFALFVPERVSGVTIYNLIPFFETTRNMQRTTYSGDLRNVSFDRAMIDDLESLRPSKDYRLTLLDISIHDGWIHAEDISEYPGLYYRYRETSTFLEHNTLPDIEALHRDFRRADTESEFWLDASEGEIFELSGISAGAQMYPDVHLPKGYFAKMYVKVPSRLGTAVIYHIVPVYFSSEDDVDSFGRRDITQSGWDITIPITVSDDILIFAR